MQTQQMGHSYSIAIFNPHYCATQTHVYVFVLQNHICMYLYGIRKRRLIIIAHPVSNDVIICDDKL